MSGWKKTRINDEYRNPASMADTVRITKCHKIMNKYNCQHMSTLIQMAAFPSIFKPNI